VLEGAERKTICVSIISGVCIQMITFLIGCYHVILGEDNDGLIYQHYTDLIYHAIISIFFSIECRPSFVALDLYI
jgi:hypothetical protein